MPRANLQIAAAAALLVLFSALFVIAWRDPELIDLGPRLRPAGIGVIGASLSFFWLLAALGMRKRKS